MKQGEMRSSSKGIKIPMRSYVDLLFDPHNQNINISTYSIIFYTSCVGTYLNLNTDFPVSLPLGT